MRDIGEYQFVIPGACPPKGSKVPVRKGSSKMRESSKRVEPWMDVAKRAMRDPLGRPLAKFSGPVYVSALFLFKRPEVTEAEFPVAPTIGDLDKLLRSVLDALTQAGVIEDDRFVVELADRPRKLWGERSETIVRIGQAHTAAFWCSVCDLAEPHDHDRVNVGAPGLPRFIPGVPIFPNPYDERR